MSSSPALEQPIRWSPGASKPEWTDLSRCVFVDWHGVLCSQPFWHSVLGDLHHPHHDLLTAEVDALFAGRGDLVASWMRGKVSSREVVATMGVGEDLELFHRLLIRDCRTLSPDPRLLGALGEMPSDTIVVLATDNMDCFAEALSEMEDLRGVVDLALCSSDLGVLKADAPCVFFGELLASLDVPSSRALLIDDAEHNCRAFEEIGGEVICTTSTDAAIEGLHVWKVPATEAVS